MLLRSNDHWGRYFVELLVVISGVTIAILLDSWYEERKDRDLELKYLHSFHTELQSAKGEISRIVEQNRDGRELVMNFIAKLQQGKANRDSSMLMLVKMIELTPFTLQPGTYQAMQSRGIWI